MMQPEQRARVCWDSGTRGALPIPRVLSEPRALPWQSLGCGQRGAAVYSEPVPPPCALQQREVRGCFSPSAQTQSGSVHVFPLGFSAFLSRLLFLCSHYAAHRILDSGIFSEYSHGQRVWSLVTCVVRVLIQTGSPSLSGPVDSQ